MQRYKIIHFNEKLELFQMDEKIDHFEGNDTVVFMKDGCTTVIENMDIIMEKIDALLENNDLFYMANVMDSCNKKIETIDEFNGLKIYFSKSPNGFYCTAAKKTSWMKIVKLMKNTHFTSISSGLNSLVVSGKIKALTSWPRIYNTGNAYDFYPCRDDSLIETNSSQEYQLSVYYFIFACCFLTIFLATFHRYS